MDGWRITTISKRRDWAPGLWTFTLSEPLAPFTAGQFVNLGISLGDGERLTRSYSMASPPGEPPSFFCVQVEGGALTPRLYELGPGDEVVVHPRPAGYFVLSKVPDAEVLWLLATGTGLGPYLSMLGTEEPWRRYRRIVVVHSVREVAHLAYRDELAALSQAHDGRLTWVPVATREALPAELESVGLSTRITAALADRSLEAAAGVELSPETSQVLLCGNPGFIRDARPILAERGLKKHRRRDPGHVTAEAYWQV